MFENNNTDKIIKDIDDRIEKLIEEEKTMNLVVLGENPAKLNKFKEMESKYFKKIVQGKYQIDQLLDILRENGAVKLILDVDALEGGFDESNLRRLVLNIQNQNLILYSDKDFPSELLENIGIYNYTKLPEGVEFLLDNPRTQRQTLKDENAILDKKISDSLKIENSEMPKLDSIEEIDEDTPSSLDNSFDYSNSIPKIEDIKRLSEYCFKMYEEFKNKCDADEERNKQFKTEYKNYECSEMYSAGCEVRIMNNGYKTSCFKDYESFVSSINNGNITSVMSLEIDLCLDYLKGPGNNLVEHKNLFEIKFKPYEIYFNRKSDFNELTMNNIEHNINDIMNSFDSVNTIFYTK